MVRIYAMSRAEVIDACRQWLESETDATIEELRTAVVHMEPDGTDERFAVFTLSPEGETPYRG